jgi:nicotinamidase-related amidase
LLLIDVINPMDFPGAEALLEPAQHAADRIRALKERCARHGIPAIYVNDNYDCWHLGFQALVEKLRTADVPGCPIIERLAPDSSRDFYILKPSHSGFFSTALEVLLARLGSRILIMTGFAGDICVLFTANDAYMRGFEVVVPRDCIASESARSNEDALEQMERLLKAKVTASEDLDLGRLLAEPEAGRAP